MFARLLSIKYFVSIIKGRQENKRVKIRYKAEKEGEAKKETVEKFKVNIKNEGLKLC